MSRTSFIYIVSLPLLIGCTDSFSEVDDVDRGPLGKAELSGSCVRDGTAVCDAQSDGTCWCDDECIGYGDCCDDHEAACLDTNAVVIDESGDGATFQVTKGQTVILRLSSNPSTGYAWKIDSTNRTFGYPFATTFTPDGPGAGSGGITEMRWTTVSPLPMLGAHTVELSYDRPWEGTNELRFFSFTVEIVAECMSDEDYCAEVCSTRPAPFLPPNCTPPSCDCGNECMSDEEYCDIVCEGHPAPFLPPECVPPSCDCPPPPSCFTTGCSGQICASEHMYTTCEWLPQYACIKLQICEPQSGGFCGWTPTPEAEACFDSL